MGEHLPTPPPIEKILKSGSGWRIGWNPTASIYPGLVGGDDWAFELTATELEDFCRLLDRLQKNMHAIAVERMAQERVACEAESASLWMQVEGYPDRYDLRLILSTGRCCEGNWAPESVPHLIAAAQSLKIF